jgi:acid phosphatase
VVRTNYYAVTHPSEPNYCAAAGGDYFGMDNDDFHTIPANVSTVVDMLDSKGISWAAYQEDLPYAGFLGFNFSNQKTFANDYVRKHNPLALFQSITNNDTRLSLIKNFTTFQSDVAAQTLPQWAFITPNMTNDGHDTNVTFAASWESRFLAPLLNNTDFMNGTLLMLTYDEDETYTKHNNIFTILIGGPGVIPDDLKGTTDSTFYNHYSTLSTVSLNWGLPSLGRWDCEANVLALLANMTGYKNADVDVANLYFNHSYPGPLSDTAYLPRWPAPDTKAKCAAGLGVLPGVQNAWLNTSPTYNYTNVYPYDTVSGNSVDGTPVTGGQAADSSASGGTASSPSGSATGSAPASTSSKASGAGVVSAASGAVFGLAGLVAWALV